MSHQTDEFLPTRRSLLNRLKDWGDQESWQEFFELYSRLIHSVALKAGLTKAEAQEVLQETVITVSCTASWASALFNPAFRATLWISRE